MDGIHGVAIDSVCGWYLTNLESSDIKPLQLTDLDDIYLIEN